MLPFGRPRFGGPVPAGLLAGIAVEAELPTGVPTEDWDPGVEDRSLSKNEAIDDDRSLEGTLDCEEGTCRDYSMERQLNDPGLERSEPDSQGRQPLPLVEKQGSLSYVKIWPRTR